MLSIRKKESNEKRRKFDKRSENFMSSFSGPVMPQNVESIIHIHIKFICMLCKSHSRIFFAQFSNTDVYNYSQTLRIYLCRSYSTLKILQEGRYPACVENRGSVLFC